MTLEGKINVHTETSEGFEGAWMANRARVASRSFCGRSVMKPEALQVPQIV